MADSCLPLKQPSRLFIAGPECPLAKDGRKRDEYEPADRSQCDRVSLAQSAEPNRTAGQRD